MTKLHFSNAGFSKTAARCLRRGLLTCFLAVVVPPAFATDLLQGLAPADVEKINSGKSLYVAHEVGKPWPRAVVYRFVRASPREVMAVFTNYADAWKFVPNVVGSRVIKDVAPWEQEVAYELSVPLLPNESYTATNLLAFRDHGRQLEVSWKASSARYFKSSVGNLRVMDYRDGTLMRYTNLVDPGSKFATLLRGTAEKQIIATVNAIADRVVLLKTKHPAEMERDLKRLDKILEGMP